MIPVIFPSDATEFTTQGYGPLQCISCEVEEERNGIYELTAMIPADSPRFDKLVEGNIIVATHSNKGDRQPFQIYHVGKTIDGIAEVNAEHISYRLNKNVVMPFEATGVQAALNGLKNNAVEDCPFTFWTDKESNVKFKPKVPKTIKASLAGSDGSIIDTFSTGDYEFDLFEVKLWADRGEDNGITIRYGINLTELEKDTDISDIYTAIVPYWTGQDDDGNERTVMLSGTPANNIVRSDYVDAFPTARTVAVDFTDKFENQPTAEELRSAAQTYLKENVRRQLITTITASFIELAQTDQYKDKYNLGKVNLCDTVTVIHEPLNIEDKLRVTRVVYDVLADRNKEIMLGDLKKTLANVISGSGGATINTSGFVSRSSFETNNAALIEQINNVFYNLTDEQKAELRGTIPYSKHGPFSITTSTGTSAAGGSVLIRRYGRIFMVYPVNMNVEMSSKVVTISGTYDGSFPPVYFSGFFSTSGGTSQAYGYMDVDFSDDNTWKIVFYPLCEPSTVYGRYCNFKFLTISDKD